MCSPAFFPGLRRRLTPALGLRVGERGRQADFPLLISLQTPDRRTRPMYESPTIRPEDPRVALCVNLNSAGHFWMAQRGRTNRIFDWNKPEGDIVSASVDHTVERRLEWPPRRKFAFNAPGRGSPV
jgi:hypothetical protein